MLWRAGCLTKEMCCSQGELNQGQQAGQCDCGLYACEVSQSLLSVSTTTVTAVFATSVTAP
jgi:hypothetical protein